jgi:exodeoxyribonuclease III
MKLATWNVNSLKVRLSHVLDWLSKEQPDALCLQETKLEDQNFPHQEIAAAGYRALYAGQRAYNGVALLSREPGADVVASIPNFVNGDKRVLAATVNGIRVISVYVPNGQSVESDKYRYKLDWLAAFNAWIEAELRHYSKLAVLGDFNIAPDDRDVYDPAGWEGNVLVSAPERTAFRQLLALGLEDSFRLFEQPEKSYSWWDYRMVAFRRNLGLRIDHILLSEDLAASCTAARIDKAPRKLERPSDHTPVIVELA